MHTVSLGVSAEPGATEKQPDACEFLNRHRDKCMVTISAQGTNEVTHEMLSRLSSSGLEAFFKAPWTRPD